MKRVFKFKKKDMFGRRGNEPIIDFLENTLTTFGSDSVPEIKDDFKVTLIIEKKKKAKYEIGYCIGYLPKVRKK